MSKLKKPLLSLGGTGRLGKALSFVRRGGGYGVEKKPEVPDARTLAQLSWRHMYQKAVALWHALSPAEKQEWESLARPKHMTGFAWFMSQALKPNPGLYLPLQGGKMAGDIDLDKHRVLKLPLPTDDQEAATKKYHDDNLPPPGAQLVVAETEVFNGISPTVWADLDLSGTIGAQASLVMLKVWTDNTGEAVGFRKNGDTDEQYAPAADYIGGVGMFNTWENAFYVVLVATDDTGKVEWKTETALPYIIDVVAYIK